MTSAVVAFTQFGCFLSSSSRMDTQRKCQLGDDEKIPNWPWIWFTKTHFLHNCKFTIIQL